MKKLITTQLILKKKTLINKSNIMDVIFYRFYNIKIPLFLYKKHSFGIYINVILLFRLVSFFLYKIEYLL